MILVWLGFRPALLDYWGEQENPVGVDEDGWVRTDGRGI